MKNPHRALEAIEVLVGSDFGMDMESLTMEKNPKNVISRLREAGRIITEIYCISHAENSHSCSHLDWEDKKYKILKDENSH